MVDMKKIAIDISHYWKMSWYGIVTNNLLKKILETDDKNKYYLISNEKKDLSDLRNLNNRQFICTKVSFSIHKFFILPKYLKKYHIDTYFSFDQDLPFKKVCKYAIISHDIWAVVLWKWWTLKMLFKKKFNIINWIYHLLNIEKRSAQKADIIFCPSENTKKDLIKYFSVDKNKIFITYRWLDHLKKSIPSKDNVTKYILFPFSNLYSDFQYELANKLIDNWVINEIYFLRPACLNNKNITLNEWIRIINKRISDEELTSFYKNAELSIYLSSYDWFWFPPLESIFHNTPVICNNSSSIPEILDNLWIINSLNINKFLEVITNILNNPKAKKDLLIKQKTRIEIFKRKYTVNTILNHLTNL